MICGRCKNQIADNVQICPYCGQPCNATNAAPPFQPPPAQQSSALNNYKDLSKKDGFQLEFYCENCHGAIYRTPYTVSQQYHKLIATMPWMDTIMSITATSTSSPFVKPFTGMPADWLHEHEWYLSEAQRDAARFYRRCNRCGKYVCGKCLDQGTGICSGCIAAIPAICPSCSAPTGASAICAYCGAKLLTEQDQPQQAGLSSQAQAFAQIYDDNLKTMQASMQQGAQVYRAVQTAFGTKLCTRCNHANLQGTVFCQGCGVKL